MVDYRRRIRRESLKAKDVRVESLAIPRNSTGDFPVSARLNPSETSKNTFFYRLIEGFEFPSEMFFAETASQAREIHQFRGNCNGSGMI